jgi:histidyl-tRNA synthetase
VILPYLSRENRAHFERVQELLVGLGRQVQIDSSIVRGLDYYTRTVFEIHAPALGARSAICGGGRYDHLVAELGGPDLGAVGFAVGFTSTLLLVRELAHIDPQESVFAEDPVSVFVVAAGEGLEREVYALAEELRAHAISAVFDVEQRSLKAQMKLAGKGGHPFAVVLGPDEIAGDKVQLKDLGTGEQHEVARGALPGELRARLAVRGR